MIVHQTGNSMGNFNYNAYIYHTDGYSNHFHKNYELIYVLNGNIPFVLNGEKIILSKGEVLLISPYNIHSFTVPESSKVWIAVFSEDFVHSFAKKYANCIFSKFNLNRSVEMFLEDHLFFQGMPDDIYITKSCLYMVCSECVKNSKILNSKASQNFRILVTDYVSQNFAGEITLKDTAAKLGYEYHYFSSLFHQNFALNFSEYINMYRFEMACESLRDASKEITIVSSECGFSSIRNFNRVFKKYCGKTPSEYRKNLN